MAISDMRNVDWGATLKLALVRGLASAVVLVVIGSMMGGFSGPGGGGTGGAFRFLLFWTFGAAIGGILYIWMLRAISATVGQAIGIVVTVCSIMQFMVVLMVAAGDPLVFILNRAAPQFLDLADFKLFNLVAVIFVRRHSMGGEYGD
jgi:hypothetical protein